MPVFSRPLAALVLAALLMPALARADYTDDYIEGLAALDHGQYERAVQSLKKALAARPESSATIRIEDVPQPYLPHHFLGMAQYKLGDCDAAKAQWNDPANDRSLGRLHQLRTQEERLLTQCKPAAASAEEKPVTPQNAQTATVPAPASPAVQAPQIPAQSKPASAASVPPGLPPALVRAFDDLMAGRFGSAAKLDADALTGARARFQGYLLRSAARFALSRSGDASQLAAARNDAHAAQTLDQSTPDEHVFSPAFRAFYAALH